MGHAELEGQDTSSKGEELTVHVTYRCGKGRMDVNVPAFLRMRKMGKYKKLMSLIRQSDTPEAAEKIVRYIRETHGGIVSRVEEAATVAVRARTRVKETEVDIDRLVALRDKYKKGTERYKECSQWVKDARQIRRDLSSLARSYEAEFKALRKDREFYQKIIKMEDAG